jgi:hypothetical protein
MSRTLHVTDVPDKLHEALESRARQDGVSVSELIVRQLQEQASTPISADELLERLQRLPNVEWDGLTAAELIREGREERTDQILDAISRR